MGFFEVTWSVFAAAGFTEEEQREWLLQGMSCAEAEAARADGLNPRTFRELSRLAQSDYRQRVFPVEDKRAGG